MSSIELCLGHLEYLWIILFASEHIKLLIIIIWNELVYFFKFEENLACFSKLGSTKVTWHVSLGPHMILWKKMGAWGEGVVKQWERKQGGIIGTKEPEVVSCHPCVRRCFGFLLTLNGVYLGRGPTPSRGGIRLLWSRWLLPPPPLMIVCGAHQLKTVGIRNKKFFLHVSMQSNYRVCHIASPC